MKYFDSVTCASTRANMFTCASTGANISLVLQLVQICETLLTANYELILFNHETIMFLPIHSLYKVLLYSFDVGKSDALITSTAGKK